MKKISVQEIKSQVTLSSLLIEFGWPSPCNSNKYRSRCLFHGGHNPTSFSADLSRNTWKCFSCGRSGDQIAFVMQAMNCDFKTAFRWLADRQGINPMENMEKKKLTKQLIKKKYNSELTAMGERSPETKRTRSKTLGFMKIVETYDYYDESGKPIYQVVRYEPKTFRIRHKKNNKYEWGMKGLRKVLYNLPGILKAKEIWVVEGEKDAKNLINLEFAATCNAGGAGNWDESYTEFLSGKDIIICPDNDEAGARHAEIVMKSVKANATTVTLLQIPPPSKDVSDFISLWQDSAKEKLVTLLSKFKGTPT